ncbi:MAG: FAD-dependent oxidoreductase [Sulfurimonas sp.]|nr:FAD-dependent oxidoreductase [Sulfurimonas sp.]
MKTILIIGGGFAGLEAAIFLKKENYDVSLVSDRDYFYIYPTSIWVPTRESEFKDVCVDLNELKDVHGFKLIIDKLTQIDAKANSYTFLSGKILKDFDYVVLAMGASKLMHKGLQHTSSICGIPEASLEIRSKLDDIVAKGKGNICFGFGGNPKDSSAVRGGPAFELLFNVHHLLEKKGIRDNYKLTFFAPMVQPGKRMGEKSLEMLAKFFKKLKIEQHFGKKIRSFEADGIIFEDDTKLDSDFTMFIPAGNGHDVVQNSDLPTNEAGFISIDDNCKVESPDFDNIYAIGDVTALEGDEWRAKQGHIAEVMAKNVAHNIKQRDSGGSAFKGYKEHLNILCVMDSGDGAAFVYRDAKKSFMVPLPIVGHWLKKAWGSYCKYSKLGKIPRIPGM